MTSGYLRSASYIGGGLGCGVDTSCGCERGLADLLNPETWGPADWLLAAGAAWIGWKLYKSTKRQRYARLVRRRLGAE